MRRAVAYSGGADRGAFHAGIASHLVDQFGRADWLRGNSTGSISAGMEGRQGGERVVRAVYESLRRPSDAARVMRTPMGLALKTRTLKPLAKLLDEYGYGQDLTARVDVAVVWVTSQDGPAGRVYEDRNLNSLHRYQRPGGCLASCTMPKPLMERRRWLGRVVMDGGAGGRTVPVFSADEIRRARLDVVDTVCCSPLFNERRPFPDSGDLDALEETWASFDLWLAEQQDNDVRDQARACAEAGIEHRIWAPTSWKHLERIFPSGVDYPALMRARIRLGEEAFAAGPRTIDDFTGATT